MKIAIVGSRKFANLGQVREYVRTSMKPGEDVLVSGGAIGVDSAAEEAAREFGIETKIFLPEYDKHGRGAAFVRNTLIAEEADLVVAFWDGSSNGTRDTIRKAVKMKKDTFIFFHNIPV